MVRFPMKRHSMEMTLYKVVLQEAMGADREMQSLVRLGEGYEVLISVECMEGNGCSRVGSGRPL